MAKPYIYDWHWQLKSSPEELWTHISDTHRLNQVTGMPKIYFEDVPQADGTSKRYAHAPIYSWLSLDWEESPFDWVKPIHHRVRRVFSSRLFPIRALQNVFNLYPLENGGTDLQFELTLEPNGLLGRLLIPGIAKNVHASFQTAFLHMDEYIQNGKDRPFETPLIAIDGAGRTRFDSLMAELRRSRHIPELIDRFETHFLNSAVEELTRMRPYAYADQWGTDRSQTLAVFLHATSLGLLDLSWDILCPECRGAKHQTHHLSDLPETVHCPACNIDYQAHFDQSIEATFNINPEIVEVTRRDYCIGGPHATPHVVIQQILAPGESRRIVLPMKEGYYRLRAPRLGGPDVRTPASILAPIQGQPWLSVTPYEAISEIKVDIQTDDLRLSSGAVQAGEVSIEITNHTTITQVLLVEDGRWSHQLATAADVTALQAFRDLFSSEALRPGYTISIQNMVVLFSDLKDSTAMYRTVGDAAAFGTVIDHFDILRQIITRHHGGVVKTLGDSVMAVFRDPADGFRAALDMQRGIDAFNRSREQQPLRIKIGLHQGPCIAVTLNERLDYFGSTVNIAARLEGQSSGNDIITSDAIIVDPLVEEILRQEHLQVDPFVTSLKGFEDHQQLYRVCW
jgi:class 3 adenylate cyclase